ncbi:protein of unknown function [Ruminococcaceae bacterium BL-4]|nr:protein of unknown function [Ruminococcaceae bacterium BL-4]
MTGIVKFFTIGKEKTLFVSVCLKRKKELICCNYLTFAGMHPAENLF